MTRKLDIACIGTLPPHPGGSAISCAQILRGLTALGHRVRVLAPITPETSATGSRFAAASGELRVRRFVMPHFDIAPPLEDRTEYRRLERARVKKGLGRLLAGTRPDLLLVGRESFAREALEVARVHRLPAVVMVRGGSRTSRLLGGDCPADLAGELLAAYRKADLLIAAAAHLERGLRALGLTTVTTIPNAVDTKQFRPAPPDGRLRQDLEIREGEVVVMHVANLQGRKRSLDIVHSAPRALARDPRLIYVIVGDGPLRRGMEEAGRRQGVAGRFRYVGWVDYERVSAYLNLADIVAMPSESEGMARVYLETQACGRLLLASDIPAAREVVADRVTGLLFRPGDVADLTATTLLAARAPDLRRAIGRRARAASEARSLDGAVAAYGKALAKVREQRQPERSGPLPQRG